MWEHKAATAVVNIDNIGFNNALCVRLLSLQDK